MKVIDIAFKLVWVAMMFAFFILLARLVNKPEDLFFVMGIILFVTILGWGVIDAELRGPE